jgi:hypothetical protein
VGELGVDSAKRRRLEKAKRRDTMIFDLQKIPLLFDEERGVVNLPVITLSMADMQPAY